MVAWLVAHSVRLERDRDRPGALVALSAPQEHRRTGDVSARVDVLRRAAKCRVSTKSLAGPSVLIYRPLGGADDAADDVVKPPSSASRVVCAVASSGLRLS